MKDLTKRSYTATVLCRNRPVDPCMSRDLLENALRPNDVFSSQIIVFKSPSTPARIFRILRGKRRCHAFGPNVYLASPRVSGRKNILLISSRRDCKAPSPALGGRSASRDLRGLQVCAINSNSPRLRVHVLCQTQHPNFAR